MNWQAVDVGILGPAMAAGLLVLVSHVPLGRQVLSRGIVFIDLAIAQVAGLGVVAADAFGLEARGWGVQIAAVSAALLGSLLLTWTDKHRPEVQEAVIGVLFVLASSAEILLLSSNPKGGEHLKDLLVGQILWVNFAQLLPVAILTGVFALAWFRFGKYLRVTAFYALFALMITASVQLVGVYLVFASLIVPALACYRHAPGKQLPLGYAVGIVSYAAGLALSAMIDLPSGAVVVCTLVVVGVVVHLSARTARSADSAPRAAAERLPVEDAAGISKT